jgi:serine/threonine-protein kinase
MFQTLKGSPSLARTIALRAVQRGWLDPATLFELGHRAAQTRGAEELRAAFASHLTEAQLDALFADDGAQKAVSERPSVEAARDDVSALGDQGAIATLIPPPSVEHERYIPGALLGQGGMGQVCAAIDQSTGRTIALKTLRDDVPSTSGLVRRFMDEARITAQLEHPAVIPVYDLGTLADGRPYYTMRVVRQRTLREVLDTRPPREHWPLARLCSALVQVCRAVSYAHACAVVHRDIKPENILLGDYGEVYLADWGVAKMLTAPSEGPSTVDRDDVGTLSEGVFGTLGYMPLEQIEAKPDLDGRADVFALGVVLYEILTGRFPYESQTLADIVAAMATAPVAPRLHEPGCPVVLEALCLRMLSRDRSQRPHADEVAEEIERWLEGAKEKRLRTLEAERLAGIAGEHGARHLDLGDEQDLWRAKARSALQDVRAWEPIERKRAGWALEDRAAELGKQYAHELARAVECYSQAIGYDRESPVVRRGLAALYASRAERCERERDEAGQVYYESLVREYDDGTFVARLTADATLSIDSDPSGAQVVAFRYVERDRVLHAESPLDLGTTPVVAAKIPAGSWLLVLKRDGFRDARYPLLARRGEPHSAQVRMFRDTVIGEQWAVVHAGPCVIGGDPEGLESLPRQEVVLGDFAIAKLPVTFDEYLAFVNDLEAREPALAQKRLPRLADGSEGLIVERDSHGLWVARWEVIVEGEQARRFCPRERVGQAPVCCVSWYDAVAYCQWRSVRVGYTVRLPTEFEWEKAARGADGRWFPWGDRFDATFCKMRESRPGLGQPEPVGAFATDCSPYGVLDLAGAIREWVADVAGERSAEEAMAELEPDSGAPRDQSPIRVPRGGSWNHVASSCRSAARTRNFSLSRSPMCGFRVARSLGELAPSMEAFPELE